jgi:hypothetical protein
MLRISVVAVLVVLSHQQELVLEKLVLFSRHGIRVPYQPQPHGAASYSSATAARNWQTDPAEWGGAAEAALTDHGAVVLQKMGDWFRRLYVTSAGGNGFFDNNTDSFTIYTNNEVTNRTYDSAVNFFRGFIPGFPVEKVINNEKEYSRWLFNQGADLLKDECGGPSREAIEGLFGGNASALSIHERDHIIKLSEEIGCCSPVVCYPDSTNPPDDCNTLMRMPTQWEGRFYQYYSGPFFAGAQISEYIQLLYLNNMSYNLVVPNWGQYEISRMVELHHDNLDITEVRLT